MDYDEVANVSHDAPTTPITPSQSSRYIAHEIVFTFFATFAVIANFCIIYTILRFKRMRTAPYLFIVSWAIADLSSLLFLPSGSRLFSVFDQISLPYEVYCLLSQAGAVCHSGAILFANLVAIDWVIAAYFRRTSEKFRKWYKWILGVLWTLILTILLVAVCLCWVTWLHFTLPMFFMMTSLGLAFLSVIVIHIMRLVQKLRKRPSDYPSLGIMLTTAFLNCWVLSVLNAFMMLKLRRLHPMLMIISFCLIYASSIVNFGLMYAFNADFSACFRQVLSCQRIKYQEDLAESATIQNNVNADSVSIDFRNPAS